MIALVAADKLEELMTREFPGVSAERKQVLVQSVRNAVDREQLHQIFSEHLAAEELAFYREIVVVPPATEVPLEAVNDAAPGGSAGAEENRAAGRRTAAKAASASAP